MSSGTAGRIQRGRAGDPKDSRRDAEIGRWPGLQRLLNAHGDQNKVTQKVNTGLAPAIKRQTTQVARASSQGQRRRTDRYTMSKNDRPGFGR